MIYCFPNPGTIPSSRMIRLFMHKRTDIKSKGSPSSQNGRISAPAEGRYSLLSVQDGSAPLTRSAPPARKRPGLSESSDIVPPPPGNLITRVLSPPGHRPVRPDLIISQLPSIAPPVKSCSLALPPACATLCPYARPFPFSGNHGRDGHRPHVRASPWLHLAIP